MAVQEREQGRARVLYRLPEQREMGPGGGPGLVAMLAIALVLFVGGTAIGRWTAPEAAVPATPPTSAAGAPAPSPSPGETVGGAGPRRVVDGVPVGYARSRAGAVAAATNYSTVLSSAIILDKTKRTAAIDVIAAPDARGRLQRDFDEIVPQIAKGLRAEGAGGADVLLRAIPVGWRVDRYDDDQATVSIWASGLLGSVHGVPVRAGWGVTTIQLRWVDGDWKETGAVTRDGPVPIADDRPPTAASVLIPQAEEFKEYHYAPGS